MHTLASRLEKTRHQESNTKPSTQTTHSFSNQNPRRTRTLIRTNLETILSHEPLKQLRQVSKLDQLEPFSESKPNMATLTRRTQQPYVSCLTKPLPSSNTRIQTTRSNTAWLNHHFQKIVGLVLFLDDQIEKIKKK